MHIIDTILFVYSEQPAIDRGWEPKHTKVALLQMGFKIETLFVKNKKEIFDFFKVRLTNFLVWPVCYTIGGNVNGCLLVDVLDQLKIPFIGPSAEVLKLNSKINLKHRLLNSQFKTPDYKIVTLKNLDRINFPYPYIMKSEYSCDSKGVSIVHANKESRPIYCHLKENFRQRVFAEKWEREQEYTVAFIPNGTNPIIAPIEMIVRNDILFINLNVKHCNDYLRFKLPSNEILLRLKNFVSSFADFISADGYFRVDILLNKQNIFHIIDMNFLPQMNSSSKFYSYFPMCFKLNYGLNFQQVIFILLKTVQKKRNFIFTTKIAKYMKKLEFPMINQI